jgi:alpha-galactosidase
MRVTLAFLCSFVLCVTCNASAQAGPLAHNKYLTVRVRAKDGSYEIFSRELSQPVLISEVGAEVSHQWVNSASYPRHQVSQAAFNDALGSGQALTIAFSGLAGKPDLICGLHVYDDEPYGYISVSVENDTGNEISVQAVRVVDAVGKPLVGLGAGEGQDRVLAESVSEDPTIHIGSLSEAPHGSYFGVRNVLIYNMASKQSLMLAALTSKLFLTVSRLQVGRDATGTARISSFTVDSTGTTQAMLERDPIPRDQQVQLSLPVASGTSLSSESVMFAAGPDYLKQLEAYGKAVHRLHRLHFSNESPMGWWSWTAFYGGINEGEALTNALWLSRNLRLLGYDYFHIDEGYDYARGEYITPNATQFPHGMSSLEHQACRLGLVPAIWTAPFEVSERSWVYQNHPEWLVHDANGKPIFIGYVGRRSDRLYVLDTTHPGAQAYLRHTYSVLTQQWGLRYIKLDFMDSSAIEGYYYRPHTTALEAQRIGLSIIRQAVGRHVLLDKDGSVMLNPVGLVDEGRIAPDTGHSFSASRDAAPNIAARFYMNGNFYVADPDAFSVSRQLEPQQTWHESRAGLTLNEAQVQIVLAAVAGGMYEIGDDLPTLGLEPRRLALVENQELIDMDRLGKTALPLDLMTFRPEDEEPSVFYLREDQRQAVLAVFNWTEQPRSHDFTLAEFHLAGRHSVRAFDVLNRDASVSLEGGALRLENQPPHSVRLIKLVDVSVPAGGPSVSARVPGSVRAGDSITFSAEASGGGVPATGYRWDFGDGTEVGGPSAAHTYTMAGTFIVHLTVSGVEGLDTHQTFTIAVTGSPNTSFRLKLNRRYTGVSPPGSELPKTSD